MDSHLRTIVKSLTWRVGGLILTFAAAWAITRRLDIAASIGAVDTLVKVVAFYVHERVWLKVRFGQIVKTDYEI